MAGRKVFAEFDRADVDNNVPRGTTVPLTLIATVLDGKAQKQLTSTAEVRIIE